MGQQASAPAGARQQISYPRPIDVATARARAENDARKAHKHSHLRSVNEEATPVDLKPSAVDAEDVYGLRIMVRGKSVGSSSHGSSVGDLSHEHRVSRIPLSGRNASLDSAYGSGPRSSGVASWDQASNASVRLSSSPKQRRAPRSNRERPLSQWSDDTHADQEEPPQSRSVSGARRISHRLSHKSDSETSSSSPRFESNPRMLKKGSLSGGKGKRPTISIVSAERMGSARYAEIERARAANAEAAKAEDKTTRFVVPEAQATAQHPPSAAPSLVRVLEGHPANHHNRFNRRRSSAVPETARRTSEASSSRLMHSRQGSLDVPDSVSMPRQRSLPRIPADTPSLLDRRRSSAKVNALRARNASTDLGGRRLSLASNATSASCANKVEVPLVLSDESQLYARRSSKGDVSGLPEPTSAVFAIDDMPRRISRQSSFPSSVAADTTPSTGSRKTLMSPAGFTFKALSPSSEIMSPPVSSKGNEQFAWHSYSMVVPEAPSTFRPLSETMIAPDAQDGEGREEDLTTSFVSSPVSNGFLTNEYRSSLIMTPLSSHPSETEDLQEGAREKRPQPSRSVSSSTRSMGRTEREMSCGTLAPLPAAISHRRPSALETIDPSLLPVAAPAVQSSAAYAECSTPSFEGFAINDDHDAQNRGRNDSKTKTIQNGNLCSPGSFPIEDYFVASAQAFAASSAATPSTPSIVSAGMPSPAIVQDPSSPGKLGVAAFGTLVTYAMACPTPMLSPTAFVAPGSPFAFASPALPQKEHAATGTSDDDTNLSRTRIGPDVSIAYDPVLSRRRFSSAPVDPRQINGNGLAMLDRDLPELPSHAESAVTTTADEDEDGSDELLTDSKVRQLGDANKRGFDKVEIRGWLLQNRRDSQVLAPPMH